MKFPLSWLFIPLSLLISCNPSTEKSRNTLKINFHESPVTFDPRKNGDPYSSTLIFMLYDGLTNTDREGKTTLSLAESVDISPDLKTYIFHLREAKWSNGEFVTAHDFEYSWKRVLAPHFPSKSAHLFFPILNAQAAKRGDVPVNDVGVKALDNWTLLVNLEHSTPYFLELVSFSAFFPVPAHLDEKSPDWEKKPNQIICNGAFQISKWAPGQQIVLKANPHYWDKSQVHLDGIDISLITNEHLVFNLFERGEVDVMGGILSPIPSDAIPTLMSQKKLYTHPKAGTFFTSFNIHDPLFCNAKIRQALTYAIDRKALVDHVTQLNEEIALGIVPTIMKEGGEEHPFFNDHDIDRARALFAEGCKESGIDPHKFPVTHCLYANTELQRKIAQTLQQQWRETLGIRVEIDHLEMKTLLDRLACKDYQIGLVYWLGQYNDPMSILERFLDLDIQKNFSGWTSDSFQRIVNESCKENNRSERLKLLREAEGILIQDMPVAPLFYIRYAYIVNPKLKDVNFLSTRSIQVKWASWEDLDEE